jgi:hypothetical protein
MYKEINLWNQPPGFAAIKINIQKIEIIRDRIIEFGYQIVLI